MTLPPGTHIHRTEIAIRGRCPTCSTLAPNN